MFSGYLIKVNGTIFPNEYIKLGTYQVTPNQIQDDDSYVDGNGLLHRSTLPHKRTKIEFTTPTLHESDNAAVLALIPNTLTVTVEYWNPKTGTYQTGTCYTPDLVYEVFKLTESDIIYNPLRIAFIEY